MTSLTLSLADFRASRTAVPAIDKAIGVPGFDEEMYPAGPGFIYAEGFWIALDPDHTDAFGPAYYLEIERSGWAARTLDDLEATLYDWAVHSGWFRT